MSSWVLCGNEMLNCYDTLTEKMQEAYAFIKDYESLLRELQTIICAVRHVETICKNEGFSVMTSRRCKRYIITHVLGNAHYRQVRVGLKMLEYFNREEALLTANMSINISSDIIESTFGIYKSKKSPNKLYGITPFVLTIPLYSKVSNESVTKTINFKERIVNVKLKDISTWSFEHLSKNWVTERTKTLRKVSKIGTTNWTPNFITLHICIEMQYLCRYITNILHIEKPRKTLYTYKIQIALTIIRRISIFMVNIT